MNRFRSGLRVMLGKIDPRRWSFWTERSGLYGELPTTNYARNDYDLFRAIFYGSIYGDKGDEYILGSFGGKPIVNSAAAFAIGTGIQAKITVPGDNAPTTPPKRPSQTPPNAPNDPKPTNTPPEEVDPVKAANQEVDNFLKREENTIFDWIRHAYRDGDGYILVDEFGRVEELDAKTVEVMCDPVTGHVIGYDVTEVVEEMDPNTGSTTTYKILKQYREDSVQFIKITDNNTRTAIFTKIYTDQGPVVNPEPGTEFLPDTIVKKPLPIIHLANEPEARDIYGNSEYQNVLNFMAQYHGVLAEATKGVIYNNAPVPWFKGVQDPSEMAAGSQDAEDKASDNATGRIRWGQDSAIMLEGENAAVGFLQGNPIMSDNDSLLQIYFYLILQASETPEYVFGAAVQSSKASTDTQVPVVMAKAKRKRIQMTDALQALIRAWVDRQVSLSNPTFTKLKGKPLDITPVFAALSEDDKSLTNDTLQALHDKGVITDETLLRLSSVGPKIDDVQNELRKAKEEAKAQADNTPTVDPAEHARLAAELALAQKEKGDPTPSKKTPPKGVVPPQLAKK